MQIKTINSTNKLLFFGGPYSNLHALEALKTQAYKMGFAPELVICTGDIVGYCAQPSLTLDFVQNWGIHAIQGNVEMSLLDEADDCGCNFEDGSRCDVFSRQWFPFAQSKMTKRNLNYMAQLPAFITVNLGGKKVFVLHGSVANTSEFIFKSTPWQTKQANFDKINTDIIVGGHCGLPFVDIQNNKTWLNAGVIGMPANDGQTHTWFMTLELLGEEVRWQFYPLEYNYTAAQNLMRENPLPESYAATLSSGIWDNCEILPQEETQLQGKPILPDQ